MQQSQRKRFATHAMAPALSASAEVVRLPQAIVAHATEAA